MKGLKCSLIFMRKVANRLDVLEERYKSLAPKERAKKINMELIETFCVGEREIQRWKKIVNVAKSHTDNIVVEATLPPSHYEEIAKLPKEKQGEVIKEVAEKNLTYKQTASLVDKVLGKSQFQLSQEEIEKIEADMHILYGDFREKGNAIPDNSINLILTDPPYGGDWLKLWEALGNLAKRVLVPSGYLVAYSGQLYFPQVIADLSKYLTYYWTLALKLKSRNLVNTRNIYNLWKPILIFQKPPLTTPQSYLCDFIDGLGAEKNNHKWQQEESEIYHLISYFCAENGTVLDPMAGSGTTLVAAKKLHRQYIGIEIDSENLPKIAERLQK